MSNFVYSAWFLDTEAHSEDQDREWVAFIGIEATREKEAQDWGDTLARHREQRIRRDTFLRSSIEREDESIGVADWSSLPRMQVGESPTDDVIGW